MNKSELIHEIYEFDKELTDYGLKKEIKLHNNYYLCFGTLHRKIGNNTIFVSDLTTYNKEKELLAFYETFFHDFLTRKNRSVVGIFGVHQFVCRLAGRGVGNVTAVFRRHFRFQCVVDIRQRISDILGITRNHK